MNDLERVEIDRDVVEAAKRRALEQGLTVTEYISQLSRRAFERAPGEDSVLVYEHVEDAGEIQIDREPGESDESYDRRSALYGDLFGRRQDA